MAIDTVFASLRRIATHALFGFVFVLSLVWPRDDALWVFGAKGGAAFVDNSKYLYCYVATERPNVRVVWLSRNPRVIEELRTHGYEAYHADSLRGILLNLRAGFAFTTHGVGDVNLWCSGGATVVELWHGVGLKTVGWDHGLETDRRLVGLYRRLAYPVFKRPDWHVVTSEAMVGPLASGRGLDPSRIVVAGYPRNDFLAGEVTTDGFEANSKSEETCRRLHDHGTVLIYAPTYHDATDQRVAEHLDLVAFDDWLREHDAFLVIKPHPNERFDAKNGAFARIVWLPPEDDIYPVLGHTDVLITDYSSVYFDYLLLDKPVVFYPFDLEAYREKRGFYLDYERVTPGPMATSFGQLLTCLEETLESDGFVEARRAVRDEFLARPTESRCKTICDRFDPAA